MSETATPVNWAGNIAFRARRFHSPASLSELQEIVSTSRRARVLGTGHCFNRIADTDGDLISLAALPSRIDIDAAGSTVTVAGGLRYSDVAEPLHRAGFALANLASLPHISVAGAIATGTHGSGDANRSLAAAVSALEIVGPDGDMRVLSRRADPDRFPGAVVSLGTLGVVTAVTLDIEPTFEVAQHVYTGLPLERLADDAFGQIFAAGYSVSVFTDWRGPAEVWVKSRTDQRSQGADKADAPYAPGARWLGAERAHRPRHPIPGVSAAPATAQLGVPGPWHLRLPHFRPDFTPSSGAELQSEYFLPREAAASAIRAVRDLGEQLAPVLQISEIRTVAADDLWLSPAYGRDSVTVHFTWVKDEPAVATAAAAVESLLLPLGARPHWGKVFAAGPADVSSRYDRAADFRKLRDQCDPAGKFGNDFVDGLFPPD
jgi:xylitol oxidase